MEKELCKIYRIGVMHSIGESKRHIQRIYYKSEDGEIQITRMWCSCHHGALYPKNWENGEKICWHLEKALVKFKEENESKGKV